MKKHTILFLAANPRGTTRIALDEEARAIQHELERSGHRDRFELVTRWATEPLDFLRELRKLAPTVVHFSGHGGRAANPSTRGPAPTGAARRDISGALTPTTPTAPPSSDLLFHGPDGLAQPVTPSALAATVEAVGTSVKVVVLNACYSDTYASALLAHVDCVVGMDASIDDRAATVFSIGFYGGLGEREPLASAFAQGRAAIALAGLPDADRPQLRARPGLDPSRLIL